MKKRILLIIMSIVLSLSCLTSCVLPTSLYENGMEYHEFDFEAIGELVQNYITGKYGIDCELTTGSIYSKSGERYMRTWFKTSNSDNEYRVVVCPETDKDMNGDGYYDSYYIKFDGYFETYIQPMVIPWINDLAEEYVDFDEYLVFATLGYKELDKDVNAPQSVDEIISKGDIAEVYIYIIIPESEYDDDAIALEKIKGLTKYLESTNMDCDGRLTVYNQERYEKISQCSTYQLYVGNRRTTFDTAEIHLFE